MAGSYEILVLGTLATQNYELTIEATEYQRGLNPDEPLALGQASCCCCRSGHKTWACMPAATLFVFTPTTTKQLVWHGAPVKLRLLRACAADHDGVL